MPAHIIYIGLRIMVIHITHYTCTVTQRRREFTSRERCKRKKLNRIHFPITPIGQRKVRLHLCVCVRGREKGRWVVWMLVLKNWEAISCLDHFRLTFSFDGDDDVMMQLVADKLPFTVYGQRVSSSKI